LQRYFVSNDQFIDNKQVVITSDDYHHIVRVMRMTSGDCIVCCNESGEAALCTIEQITTNQVVANVLQWIEGITELPVKVYIASGMPKADKFEFIIQKGTELGAFSFLPFMASRSIVKWDAKKEGKKIERWTKIAKEAAEQSHRTRIPQIVQPMTIQELVRFSSNVDYKMIAYEEEAKKGEKTQFAKLLNTIKPGQSLLAVFGPEGGLSEKEVEILKENGFISCGLGPRILRTETAPLYLLSAMSFQFELM